MLVHSTTAGLLAPAVAVALVVASSASASPTLSTGALLRDHPTDAFLDPHLLVPKDLYARDGHGHHNSHTAPLLHLNETEVTVHHAPTPPSYWTVDIDEAGESHESRHPGLMMLHGLLMGLAFFVALPVGEYRSSERCHPPLFNRFR